MELKEKFNRTLEALLKLQQDVNLLYIAYLPYDEVRDTLFKLYVAITILYDGVFNIREYAMSKESEE